MLLIYPFVYDPKGSFFLVKYVMIIDIYNMIYDMYFSDLKYQAKVKAFNLVILLLLPCSGHNHLVYHFATIMRLWHQGGEKSTHRTLDPTVSRVHTATASAGSSFQSLMVFGKNDDRQYMVQHWIKESCCQCPHLCLSGGGCEFGAIDIQLFMQDLIALIALKFSCGAGWMAIPACCSCLVVH